MLLVVFDEAAVYVDQLQREVEEEERAHAWSGHRATTVVILILALKLRNLAKLLQRSTEGRQAVRQTLEKRTTDRPQILNHRGWCLLGGKTKSNQDGKTPQQRICRNQTTRKERLRARTTRDRALLKSCWVRRWIFGQLPCSTTPNFHQLSYTLPQDLLRLKQTQYCLVH